MAEIPESSNLFGIIGGAITIETIVDAFERQGWAVRKCSLTDFELRSNYAEPFIEEAIPLLTHGFVADLLNKVWEVAEVLDRLGCKYTLECYDEQRLMRKLGGEDKCPAKI